MGELIQFFQGLLDKILIFLTYIFNSAIIASVLTAILITFFNVGDNIRNKIINVLSDNRWGDNHKEVISNFSDNKDDYYKKYIDTTNYFRSLYPSVCDYFKFSDNKMLKELTEVLNREIDNYYNFKINLDLNSISVMQKINITDRLKILFIKSNNFMTFFQKALIDSSNISYFRLHYRGFINRLQFKKDLYKNRIDEKNIQKDKYKKLNELIEAILDEQELNEQENIVEIASNLNRKYNLLIDYSGNLYEIIIINEFGNFMAERDMFIEDARLRALIINASKDPLSELKSLNSKIVDYCNFCKSFFQEFTKK